MGDPHTLLHKLQFVVAGALVIAICFLISLLISSVPASDIPSANTSGSAMALAAASDANVITVGTTRLANGLRTGVGSTVSGVRSGVQTVASVTTQGAQTVGQATHTAATAVGRGVAASFGMSINAVGQSIVFLINIPSNMAGAITSSSVVSTLIKPADSMEVPVIDPNSPELKSAVAALPPSDPAVSPQTGAGPVWPMHGAVTTEFGTPHRPYQDTHTGMDISDGQRSGVTPIRPFRPGRVVDVIRSNRGLGNHVVVDHGNGVTSVYAHLYSIAVQAGQDVSLESILGLEGTTGVSTGPHLHFEIRVNGQAANPRHFISGQP